MKNGFASGLLIGAQAARQGVDIFNQQEDRAKKAAMEAEVKAAMEAKPTQVEGYTQQDAQQLEALAGAKDQNGQPYYNLMANQDGSYAVGSNFQAAGADGQQATPEPAQIQPQRVSDFMGQRTPGQFTPDQEQGMRTKAVASAVMKADPLAGFNLMRQANQDERDTQRFGWEKTRSESESKRIQREDADKELTRGIDEKVGAAFKSKLKNADGTERAPTMGDHLDSTMHRAELLTEAGRLEDAGKVIQEHNARAHIKIQLETEQRKVDLAKASAGLAVGNLELVKDFYNKHVPDGARVIDVEQDPKTGKFTIQRETSSGAKLPPKTVESVSDLSAFMKAAVDPDFLYKWSQDSFKNTMLEREAKRQEKATDSTILHQRRTEATAATGASEKTLANKQAEAKATAAVDLYREQHPGATPAQLAAVRTGVMSALPKDDGAYKVEAGDVTSLLGDPAVDKEGKPIMDALSGRQVVNRSPEKEQAFFKWMSDNGIKDTNKGLALYPGLRGQAVAPKLNNVTPADIAATAKKHRVSEDEVRKRLGITQ